ncbi:MAG: baseplate J/gp47 family protein [Pseudomonadota bacterium]
MFPTPDYSTLRTALLRDIANQLPDAATGSDSDFAIRANAVAAALEGLYQHQQWIARQILPDTADSDYLERWASLYGINKKPAVPASGTITFTASSAAVVPVGTEVKTVDGIAFVTTATGNVAANGALTLAASALTGGVSGNLPAGTILTLSAAPIGINSSATIATNFTGGEDVESESALLSRLKFRLRNAPHGGNALDYLAWARAVPGVAEAYVLPLRRGVGTVDIVIEGIGNTAPSLQIISSVQAAINAVKPVAADCLVYGPTIIPVPVTAQLTLSNTTLAAATASINSSLNAYFATLNPGDAVIRNKIAAIISNTQGVVDFNLIAPAANVQMTVDANTVQVASLGQVVIG